MSIALGVVALTACSAAEASDSPADPRAITVTASDTRSDLSATTAPAGTITFGIVNTGTRVTEFSVYADGDRIVSEVENLTPGLKRELQVELTEQGTFTTACKPGMLGDGLRSELTLTGTAAKRSADAKVARAIAKELYPTARLPWETIEPVESFGDLDPRIDGREDVIEDGREFTGYHRLEKDLWVDGLQAEATDGAGRAPEAAPGGLVGGGPQRPRTPARRTGCRPPD
ncbi:cupredoxin domain-containing protein [Intrasporangium calvum]|uniref:cupredoxin domain-containing protein n=1 Tax=Intrasporangium calvum TaxID=53358 RepID=UPI001FD50841|nr:cupredoxin domain-containing protein [Intrasporangium calvum]